MKLTKQPETQEEYWATIEHLGAFKWRMKHDLYYGRVIDSTGGIIEDISDAQKISDRLVKELGEKFGVIHPNDCPKIETDKETPPAPEGKIYYWDWYKKMENEFYTTQHEKTICSACPFSEGISLRGYIRCSVFHGILYRLSAPYECGMIHKKEWNQYDEIMARFGSDALAKFRKKEETLKIIARQETLKKLVENYKNELKETRQPKGDCTLSEAFVKIQRYATSEELSEIKAELINDGIELPI